MTNEERIAKLEAQLDDLRSKVTDLRKQLTKAQIAQWQGRIEDLEVQMHLGAMESSDRLNALMAYEPSGPTRASSSRTGLDGDRRGRHRPHGPRERVR